MTAPEQDVMRVFSLALKPAARHHLRVDYQTIPLIRAGSQTRGPLELARIVGAGIGWQTPANPWPLMLHRLKREAGQDDVNTTTEREDAT